MAHEILAAKLSELDTEFGKLHDRINRLEELSEDQLSKEIEVLKNNVCTEECLVFKSLLESKANISSELKTDLAALQENYDSVFQRLQVELDEKADPESRLELKALFAEYEIDFAMILANHSLLSCLEALKAEKEQEEEAFA